MSSEYVGANILNIITESLYDKPIVIFREYVQNSVDSIYSQSSNPEGHQIRIYVEDNSLFFIDDGSGINRDEFINTMKSIGLSGKARERNIGYKGIGRLSGVPYCKKLHFVNIIDNNKTDYQIYTISGDIYNEIKKNNSQTKMTFSELMDKIGNEEESLSKIEKLGICKFNNIGTQSNTGFLVILEGITSVLSNTIFNVDDDKSTDKCIEQLNWLLPLDFTPDLYESSNANIFKDLVANEVNCVKFCKIFFQDKQLFRPILGNMIPDFCFNKDFSSYATGLLRINKGGIAIDKSNKFTGIRVYQDNMLLCDETEIIQSLNNYGLLEHTINGQMQSVRGIGMMIYIKDKVNIVANSRRTFIEVNDDPSFEFLKLLAQFINDLYKTRYALSEYYVSIKNGERDGKVLRIKRDEAESCLRKISAREVCIDVPNYADLFPSLSLSDKKQILKKRIRNYMNGKLTRYLSSLDVSKDIVLEDANQQFIEWLIKNK